MGLAAFNMRRRAQAEAATEPHENTPAEPIWTPPDTAQEAEPKKPGRPRKDKDTEESDS